MLDCPGSKIFKATTGGRKPGHRPPVVALSVLKVHICYDNTLQSITFEPVVGF